MWLVSVQPKYLQIAFEVFFHSGVLAQGTSKKVIGV